MLAVVKEPHTEIALLGEGAAAVVEFLRSRFSVQVVDVPAAEQDEELVDINDTEFWKENKHRVLTGARLKAGMTQKRLAELTGIRQTMISEYEKGKRRITKKAAEKFAAALQTFPEKFLS